MSISSDNDYTIHSSRLKIIITKKTENYILNINNVVISIVRDDNIFEVSFMISKDIFDDINDNTNIEDIDTNIISENIKSKKYNFMLEIKYGNNLDNCYYELNNAIIAKEFDYFYRITFNNIDKIQSFVLHKKILENPIVYTTLAYINCIYNDYIKIQCNHKLKNLMETPDDFSCRLCYPHCKVYPFVGMLTFTELKDIYKELVDDTNEINEITHSNYTFKTSTLSKIILVAISDCDNKNLCKEFSITSEVIDEIEQKINKHKNSNVFNGKGQFKGNELFHGKGQFKGNELFHGKGQFKGNELFGGKGQYHEQSNELFHGKGQFKGKEQFKGYIPFNGK